MCVLVEPDVHDVFARIPGFGFVQTFYSQDTRYGMQILECNIFILLHILRTLSDFLM